MNSRFLCLAACLLGTAAFAQPRDPGSVGAHVVENLTPRGAPAASAPSEPTGPVSAREAAKARWAERATDPNQAHIVPVEHKLSPAQMAVKMRQEKHWNDLTPTEQAKRKAAFKKKHVQD